MEGTVDERTQLLSAGGRPTGSAGLPRRSISSPNVNDSSEVDNELLRHTSRLRRHSSSLLPQFHNHSSSNLKDYGDDDEPTEDTVQVSIWTTIPILLLGVFVANADASLVIATNQHIASEFQRLSQASWLVTSYMLAQCASQPLYGKLSDIFGRKSNLITSYILFALGCLLCGVAPSYWLILLGRAISGIGGAGMTALVSIVIVDLIPVRKVAAWRSYVNLAATIGRALGGPVGGLLTDTIGWRVSFLGQCPLTLIGLLMVYWKLPTNSSSSKDEQSLREKFKRVDFVGAITLAVAVSAFLLALDFSTADVAWYYTVTAGLCWLVFTGLFWVAEKKWATEAILPIELLTKRDTLTPYLIAGVQIAAQFAAFYAIPIYLQITAGYSVTAAGLRMVPAVVGNASGSLLSGYLVNKTGRYKRLTILASITASIGYLLMLIRWRGTTTWYEGLYIFFGGFGAGIIQSTTFVHLAASLSSDEIAIAGTSLYLAQNLFLLIGIQVATVILQARVRMELGSQLSHLKDKEKFIKKVISSVSFIRQLRPGLREIVTQAYINGLTCTYALSLALAVIGGIAGLTIIERKL